MKLCIVVYGSPGGGQASATAYRYVKAALTAGHEIYRVFFYGEAVQNATRLAAPPQDEINLVQQWQTLGQDNNLDLVVCIAAAIKRGVIDSAESKRFEKDADNIHPSFNLSGLGQLIDAVQEADRSITFGY